MIPDSLGEANCSDLVLIQSPLGLVASYGAYYLNSLARRDIKAGQVGIALTHFNTKSVATLLIALPPIKEQERIVAEGDDRLSLLDAADSMVAASLKRADHLRQSILKQAFEGKLVAQNPTDEPASVLLERIRSNSSETAATATAAAAPKLRAPRSKSKSKSAIAI